MKKPLLFYVFVLLSAITSFKKVSAQCMTYPVNFEHRVSKATYIVQGKVTGKHSYTDASTGNINTLNRVKVAAWLKNHNPAEEIFVITSGGVYGNKAMRVDPSLQLNEQQEYILILEADNFKMDDKNFRLQHPQSLQLRAYTDQQGALPNNNNYYHDLFDKTPKTEATIFESIGKLTRQTAKQPSGELFQTRSPLNFIPGPAINNIITGFSPGSANAGTIVPGDEITISGSGFGASAGTVFFTNANDGGATFTSSGVASDIISWSDASITVKVAANTGTGPINVNGVHTSATNLTVPYSHLCINSSFSGFGAITRQRYYHRNLNGSGGYTYTYNTSFAGNAPAVAAFERALLSWRCNTFINFRIDASTSAIASAIDDNVNIVTFSGSLPAGVLGQATSRFFGSNTGGCNLHNTVWWVEEIDMEFAPDPPVAGFNWEYGPALPSSSEYDFESVALHEIGHHHGLGHVINGGQVMHFALANGASSRILSGTDVSGGSARVSYSTAATCFNPTGSGTPMTALTVGNCLLPVQISRFDGEKTSPTTNRLYWTTLTEINNRGFYLEKSSNAINFNPVVFINGAGNSSQTLSYQYNDLKAGLVPWYYRLRQVDQDGKEKLSKIIFIDKDNKTNHAIWATENGDRVFLYVNNAITSINALKIFNSAGQEVITRLVDAYNNEIPTSHLSRGIYYYQLLINNKTLTGKLLLGNGSR